MTKRVICALAFVCVTTLCCTSCSDQKQDAWQLVWEENFDGDTFDSSCWSKIPRGKSDWNNYMSDFDSCYHVGSGLLTLRGLNNYSLPEDTARFLTGGLYTKDKVGFSHGRLEIHAKLGNATGAWPAFWLLPFDGTQWPDGGEIDIMENVGYDPDHIVGTAHTQRYNHTKGTQKSATLLIPTNSTAFHVYALEWEEKEYRLYIDDKHYFTFVNENTGFAEWPFDKKFHLILNLAIGGNWGGQQGIDDALFPHHFYIDYVRVYQKQANSVSSSK